MKKIYSLLALFLLLMGTATSAVAQQALTTGYYRIKNANSLLFNLENPSLVVNGSALGLKAGASLAGTEDVWYVEDMGKGTDGTSKYHIKHMDTGYYMVEGGNVPLDKGKQRFYAINFDASQQAYTFCGHENESTIGNKKPVAPVNANAFERNDTNPNRFWKFEKYTPELKVSTSWQLVTNLDQLVDGGQVLLYAHRSRQGVLYMDATHACDKANIPTPASKFRVANDKVAQDVNALPAEKLAAAELTLEVTEVNGVKHYAFRFNGEGGKYYVDNTDRNGKNAGDAVHATTNQSTFTIAPASDANNHGWAIKSTVAGQTRCFLNTGGADNGGLVLFRANDPNNSLQIYRQVTTVPVRQSDNNTYATFYSDAEVVLPAGVKAYTAKEMATTVQLTAMTGNVLPANTGVLLEAAADVQTVALAHTKTNAPALTGNDFKGVTTATEIAGRNVYVFGKGSKGLGFYKPSATTLKAHAAFIESTSTQASLALSFGGEQTGVEAVETTLQADAPIYDLSGRRVTKAVKGVYIQGGKKIYIK